MRSVASRCALRQRRPHGHGAIVPRFAVRRVDAATAAGGRGRGGGLRRYHHGRSLRAGNGGGCWRGRAQRGAHGDVAAMARLAMSGIRVQHSCCGLRGHRCRRHRYRRSGCRTVLCSAAIGFAAAGIGTGHRTGKGKGDRQQAEGNSVHVFELFHPRRVGGRLVEGVGMKPYDRRMRGEGRRKRSDSFARLASRQYPDALCPALPHVLPPFPLPLAR